MIFLLQKIKLNNKKLHNLHGFLIPDKWIAGPEPKDLPNKIMFS